MASAADTPLGSRVRSLRKSARLTQQELAVRAGLSLSHVAQIKQGFNRDLRLSTLRALDGALGVDLNALGEGGPPSPKKRGDASD